MTGSGRKIWDVAVVGAGPAGTCSALAVLAGARGASVLLVDRARFPRDKACGDGVAPHVLDVLDRLGAADVVDGWAPLRRLELSHGDRTVQGRLDRPVWVIRRQVLDARLVEHAVRRGTTLTRHHAHRIRRQDGVVLIDLTVAARLVGRRYRAAVRRLVGRDLRPTWLTARLARRPRVVDAGIAAAVSDRGVFADLVELGLGDGLITTRLLRGLGRQPMRPGPS